ncbi:MAG: Rpn family recombination-promoting nuclease/putative transposase [Lutispora sp.]|nr:Rpn family recombination-promoting nuclease/putative transposase [Lutispora sp.]
MENKNQELLSPLSDIVFKALFGREEKKSKIILIDFLNSILALEREEKITEIIHLNPFNIKEYKGDKGSIFDIKIKTRKEERINIEIQINNVDDFRKRSLYYWSKMYSQTIKESESYTALKKSIVINIMDFDIIKETDRYHTEYKILEKIERFPLIDDLEIHYIELQKFQPKKDVEEMEAIELWLSFIKKAGKEEIGKLIKRKEELSIAMEMLKKISADEELREKYASQEKARLDAISSIKFAEMKGMEKGIEKGIERGSAELLIRLLGKKFGVLPSSLEKKIQNAALPVLDLLAENIFEINSVEEAVELIEKS